MNSGSHHRKQDLDPHEIPDIVSEYINTQSSGTPTPLPISSTPMASSRLLKTAATHQTSLTSIADNLMSLAFEAVARFGKSPATALAERGVVS